MKLRDLFDRIGPMFLGRASPEETARSLYGDEPGVDGKRLVLYENIQETRARELAGVFARCADAIGEAWPQIAYDYFVAHPWGTYHYHPAAEEFPGYLARIGPARALAPWLPEVAAVERSLHRAHDAANPGPDRTTGPLRLAPTAVLHRGQYDVARWILARERPPAPAERPGVAIVWRTPDGSGRVRPLDDVQVAIIEQVAAGTFDHDQVPAPSAVTGLVLAGLASAGIVFGDVSPIVDALAEPGASAVTLGGNLARELRLAPFVHLWWGDDGELQLWTPLSTDIIATDDLQIVAVASQFATRRSLRDAIRECAELLPPASVVTIVDALSEAGLLVRGDVPHPAISAGWDPREAALHRAPPVRAGAGEPPPAIRPALATDTIDLPPVVEGGAVGDRAATGPIALATFSQILGLAARNRGATGAVERPYLSLGGGYALEVYPIIDRDQVDGVAPGLYRYRPESHQLERLSDEPSVIAASRPDGATGVAILITARIGRALGGPQPSSLAAVHQEVGALIQTLHLAAAGHAVVARPIEVSGSDALEAFGVDPWAEPVLAGVVLGRPA